MKPVLLAFARGLLVCLVWFRLHPQTERLEAPKWRHPFADDWNAPGMDAYDEPVDGVQPADPYLNGLPQSDAHQCPQHGFHSSRLCSQCVAVWALDSATRGVTAYDTPVEPWEENEVQDPYLGGRKVCGS